MKKSLKSKNRPVRKAKKTASLFFAVETTVFGKLSVEPIRVGDYISKNQAKKIADGLNRVIREATFRPKNAGRRARSKGHSFEREIAIRLREIFPGARRHLEYQDSEANGVDIAETAHFRIQCKKLKQYAPVTTIDEIVHDRFFGEVPILVTAADSRPAMAVLPFDDLLALLKRFKA